MILVFYPSFDILYEEHYTEIIIRGAAGAPKVTVSTPEITINNYELKLKL